MNERILPAYPLFMKDPNYSIWSSTDELNSSNVETWFGAKKKIYGFLRMEEETYCFLGDRRDFISSGVKSAKQTSLCVTAFSTDYEFEAGKAKLKIRFVSPLPPDDMELISLPVCYMEYEISGAENAELSIFINRSISYNDIAETQDKRIKGGVIRLNGYESAYMGLLRQLPLSNNNDCIGADWGYWYLSGEKACLLDEKELAGYLATGCKMFRADSDEKYMGSINNNEKGIVMLGYDDTVSIDYFGTYLKGYYLEKHTIIDALNYTYKNVTNIDKKLSAYDERLKKEISHLGQEYYDILVASLRQSVAAHKLVRDGDGNVLFLSKECASNGCIGTVDVSYPSIPLYLLFSTELVKGMMRPILKFAKMPVWTYDFAPHDVGTYPACTGQVYGLNSNYCPGTFRYGGVTTHFPIYLLPANSDIYAFDMQMPVEECANMLIMFCACYHYDNDISFFENEKSLADKWVEYLVKYGLKPENQLCTDDFAGHLKNNINLAIKATVGIACYAKLILATGDEKTAQKYRKIAEEFAAEITVFAKKYSHLPITWDSGDNTFSLKYNFAFDKILGLNLFAQDILEKEVDCCIEKMNKYGTPLDNRKGYTKSDWLMWVASLTNDRKKQGKLISSLNRFLKYSENRIPFSDWYDTESGKYIGFRARSVQGGCFILMLG